MKAWLQLISIGMVGAMVATSCVIVDDDDDDDDNGGEAGDSSTGGRATGGRGGTGGTTGGRGGTGGTTGGRGGTGGTTGGTSPTGGITGQGGEGGAIPDSCEVESEPFGSCEFFDGNADPCEACLAENCCDEVSACFGTDPDDVCGYPEYEGEFECARSCLGEIFADGEIPNEDDIDDCLAECMKCTLPSPNTGPLVVCMDTSCSEACY
jgi:hypothetical protein